MHKIISYTILFVVTILLQIFFFDNLSLSIYLNPLIYIAIIILLPVDTSPLLTLAVGLVTGVVMDFAMGIAGINTITTVLIAFLRPFVLALFFDKNNLREGGIPSEGQLGRLSFLYYLLILTLVHNLLFFILEDLSIVHLPVTLLRFVVSSVVSLPSLWLISQIFTHPKLQTSL